MKLDNSTIKPTIDKAKLLLKKEKNISPALRAVFQLLLVFLEAMMNRLNLNSQNSSKPPSSDPHRKKSKKRHPSGKKPGGQPGRVGKQLKPVDDPDNIEVIKLDQRTLPKDTYTEKGFARRQVIDFDVSIFVTEYQAQILLDSQGKTYTAPFPSHVKRPIQYGPNTKSQSVYLSQFQLLPYARLTEYFSGQLGLPISQGTLFNFNKEAYQALQAFEALSKKQLIASARLNSDETGININGERLWLHTACNDHWTHFYPHKKRGQAAMDEIGILPEFKGVLCHDHWKPYYRYHCRHALCNAHHLRELEWAATEGHQSWGGQLKRFLTDLNDQVEQAGGQLSDKEQVTVRQAYRDLLSQAEKECPPPPPPKKKKRGRIKKTKSRNLLERFIHFEEDILRFMSDKEVPFTNNQGENDLRMTKVQQKISGCFRSEEGAKIFCRIRGYLITCRKHGIKPTQALEILFRGELPEFAMNVI